MVALYIIMWSKSFKSFPYKTNLPNSIGRTKIDLVEFN